jgi:sugar/nucleoside kinase (ribokinase family)
MEKLFDVLVVGELNVDLILNDIEKFPEIGKEVLAHGMTLTLGSSAAIFASNVSSLGAKVAFLGKIGKDKFGEVVIESLKTKHVDVSMIKTDEQAGTGATIVLYVDEDRANTTYPGAMDLLTPEDITEEDLKKARHLHFSSYFLQPGMWKGLGQMFRQAQKLGLTTSFDMQWDPKETWNMDIEAILPYVNVFLPNEMEIKFLSGKNDLYEAINYIKRYTETLVVKRGNKGSIVVHKDNLFDLPSFLNDKVVDTVGAGDSFNAGFILKYIKNENISVCQRFGNLAGAVSTTASGGTKAFKNYETFRKSALDNFGIVI